ncbi:uncharacterized protein LOC144477515 [Augochlora pura]
MTTYAKNTVTATIKSRVSDYQRTLTFLIIPTISSCIPSQTIDRSSISVSKNLILADPNFHLSAPVDLLLGAGAALSVLSVGQINLSPPNSPDLYMQKTRLGWVIGGSVPAPHPTHARAFHLNSTLEIDITRFWELEEGPRTQHLTESEKVCEDHFKRRVSRTKSGRYVVALPFNNKISQLGTSKTMALKRFTSLERKLQRDPILRQEYNIVLQDYLNQNHEPNHEVASSIRWVSSYDIRNFPQRRTAYGSKNPRRPSLYLT